MHSQAALLGRAKMPGIEIIQIQRGAFNSCKSLIVASTCHLPKWFKTCDALTYEILQELGTNQQGGIP